MNKKTFTLEASPRLYDAPQMRAVQTTIERGFSASIPTEDYEDGNFEW